MTNFPNGMTRYDWEHVEGRHLRGDDNDPRTDSRFWAAEREREDAEGRRDYTQDNEHLARPSRTTGTYGESSEFVRDIGARAFAAMPAHRTMVLSISEHRWGAWCKSCGYDHTPGAIGNNKQAIQDIAAAHENANA